MTRLKLSSFVKYIAHWFEMVFLSQMISTERLNLWNC